MLPRPLALLVSLQMQKGWGNGPPPLSPHPGPYPKVACEDEARPLRSRLQQWQEKALVLKGKCVQHRALQVQQRAESARWHWGATPVSQYSSSYGSRSLLHVKWSHGKYNPLARPPAPRFSDPHGAKYRGTTCMRTLPSALHPRVSSSFRTYQFVLLSQ